MRQSIGANPRVTELSLLVLTPFRPLSLIMEGPVHSRSSKSRLLVKEQPEKENIALGIPEEAKSFIWFDLFAVLVALLAFVVAVVAVSPTTTIPWTLGYNSQLVVLGVVLNVMFLCLKRLTIPTFVKVEAALGRSILQNYDAIIRSEFTRSMTSPAWRGVFVIMLLLPIILGVAYKQFEGASASAAILTDQEMIFGLTGPPGLSAISILALAVNATTPFMATASNDSLPLPEAAQAYGFNMLLLNDGAAAMLDAPMPTEIESLQARLNSRSHWRSGVGSSMRIEADVMATVARYNTDVDSNRSNQTWWDQFGFGSCADPLVGEPSLASMPLFYNNRSISLYMSQEDHANQTWLFIGFDTDTSDARERCDTFQSAALYFNTRREFCHGVWDITYNSALLVGGSCNGTQLPPSGQVLDDNNVVLPQFYMNMLQTYLGRFAPYQEDKIASHWWLPSAATMVVAMYWSRVQGGLIHPEPYPAQHYIKETRSVIRAEGSLYLVLVILPALVLLCYMAKLFLNSVPVDEALGLTSVLAGTDEAGRELLSGAGLSGKLKEKVRLRIGTEKVGEGDDGTARMCYAIERVETASKHRTRQHLERGVEYE